MKYIPGGCHDIGIGDGVGDGDVSVHADGDEVQDGGGAGPDIHGQPDEAEVAPEHPAVDNLIHCGQGENQHA